MSRVDPCLRIGHPGPRQGLQLQSSQTLIRNNVPSTRFLDQLRWQLRKPRCRSSLSPRLVKSLLVTHLAQPVTDQLLIITLLSLPRRIFILWPESELVRSNRIRQDNILLLVKTKLKL